MDFMPGDDLRMTFHLFYSPLSLFRVLKGQNGSIYRCSSIGGQPSYIHTLRKLFLCGVWSVYASSPTCAFCIEWVYVCVASGFTATSLYPFLFHLWVRLSLQYCVLTMSMPMLFCVSVCMCVCLYVCCGSLISGSSRGCMYGGSGAVHQKIGRGTRVTGRLFFS